MSAERKLLIDQLYGLLAELHDRCGGYRYLAECGSRTGWPVRGVYFFFDHGEARAGTAGPRVVRVGTHALTSTSRTTLWNRLSQHRGSVGGSMPGGGNHRGSIFRLHVGTALLATGDYADGIRETWGRGSSAPRGVREAEYPLERAVSAYIRALPFLWLAVDDPAGPGSERGVIERGAIAALSDCDGASVEPASAGWLGRHADRPAIRASGLWNVNHVGEPVSDAFLDAMERHVHQ